MSILLKALRRFFNIKRHYVQFRTNFSFQRFRTFFLSNLVFVLIVSIFLIHEYYSKSMIYQWEFIFNTILMTLLIIITIMISILYLFIRRKSYSIKFINSVNLLYSVFSTSILIVFFICKLKIVQNEENKDELIVSLFNLIYLFQTFYCQIWTQIDYPGFRLILTLFHNISLIAIVLYIFKINTILKIQTIMFDFITMILLFIYEQFKEIPLKQLFKQQRNQSKAKEDWENIVNEFPNAVIIISETRKILYNNKTLLELIEIENESATINMNKRNYNNRKISIQNLINEISYAKLVEKIGFLEEITSPNCDVNYEPPIKHSLSISRSHISSEISVYSHKSQRKEKERKPTQNKKHFFYHYNSVNVNKTPTNNKKDMNSYSILGSNIQQDNKSSNNTFNNKEKEDRGFNKRVQTDKGISCSISPLLDKKSPLITRYTKEATKKINLKEYNLDDILSKMVKKRKTIKTETECVNLEAETKIYCTQYKNFQKQEKKRKFELKIKRIPFHDETSLLIIIQDISYRDLVSDLRQNNEYKTKILTTLSHEIRTPLNGAIPPLEQAINDARSKLKLNSLGIYKEIKGSLKSLYLLQNVLNDVVDFALINSNQLFLNLEEQNIYEFMKETIKIFSQQSHEKSIELIYDFHNKNLPKLTADFQRIRQILVSLIGNSLKNTFEGFIEINVKIENSKKFTKKKSKIHKTNYFNDDNDIDQEALVLKFCVKDSGIGIEEGKLENIKKCLKEEDLFEVCNSLNRKKGCGLGLIISHCLALILGPKDNRGLSIESDMEGTKIEFQIEALTEKNSMKPDFLSTILETKEITRYSTFKKTEKNIRKSLYSINETKSKKLSLRPRKRAMTSIVNKCDLTLISTVKRFNSLPENTIKNNFAETSYYQTAPISHSLCSIGLTLESPKIELYNINHAFNTITFENLFKTKNRNSQIGTLLPSTPTPAPISNSELSLINYKNSENNNDPVSVFSNTVVGCTCEEALVVDDDAFNLKSIELILNKLKKRCVKAYNGEQAIKIIKEKYQKNMCSTTCLGFRLIFMDYHMPIKNGLETTKILRELMEYGQIPFIPIIACTAFGAKDLVEEWSQAGMSDFITKPLTFAKAEKMISKWI